MVVNPAGAVQIFDGGAPRIITGIAQSGISAGGIVTASGANNAVSSGANSFVIGDITFTDASGATVTGIALGSTTSGTEVAVATRGAFIVTAAGNIRPGEGVFANGGDAVVGQDGTIAGSYAPFARALTGAGSEGYCIVELG